MIHRDEPMLKGQAERLVPMLEDTLAEGGVGWRDLRKLAVGTGPGNFTGVRISVATARGLSLALGIPAVGVTRLEALAEDLPRPCRVIEDARGGFLYVQEFPDGVARLARAETVDRSGYVTGSGAGLAALPPALPIAVAIARVGAARRAGLPPAPFYLKGADAAPPSDPPPVILP